jgi:hypothetical protein
MKTTINILLAIIITITVILPAQAMPIINPSLKSMLGQLPIASGKDKLTQMIGDLKKTSCGNQLKDCYMTKSGKVQLYFFTSDNAQQTFLIVLDEKIAMPKVLHPRLQKILSGASLNDPIIAISTTDVDLNVNRMPMDLKGIINSTYYGVDELSFSSGIQIMGQITVNDKIKQTMNIMGVSGNTFTMRAGVVIPIPTDFSSGLGTAVGIALSDSLKEGMEDALELEAYVEFQLPPRETIQSLFQTGIKLEGATITLSNALTLDLKANAYIDGISEGMPLQFHTPLNAAGALDLLDFEFRFATPAKFTLQDYAFLVLAMQTPMGKVSQYGGGFISNIDAYNKPLRTLTKPLSVFQITNSIPPKEYRFGDSTKPFPTEEHFNIVLLGPLADGGPLLKVAGNARILGQNVGELRVNAGSLGLKTFVLSDITVNLGPLKKQTILMSQTVNIGADIQEISMLGEVLGRKLEITMGTTELSIVSPATCATPFEINTSVNITPTMDIAKILDAQGGVNIDPSKINCLGAALESALNTIVNEYSHLEGYSATQANQALKQLPTYQATYQAAKDKARRAAESSTNSLNKSLKDAGNTVSSAFGKKKHHTSAPDPKFASSVFDWDFYYDEAPDVVRKGVDLVAHWDANGFKEGRKGSNEFNANYYWDRYLDVQASCANSRLECALQHWLDTGMDLGRQGSSTFSSASYLNRYKDLRREFGEGNYAEAMMHWLNFGKSEGRKGNPETSSPGPIYGPQRLGGNGGGNWSDLKFCADQYVDGFRIRAGRTVDKLQFRYAGLGWSSPQGYTGAYETEVILERGEYFVNVDSRSGASLDQLKFTTNRGRVFGPYGSSGGSPRAYRVTPGEKLGCMAGRAGKTIDQLILISTGPR